MNMKERYFAMALDPIHVGTGGYRLGRVDNTIMREPGTNLPKIPGTTIEGNARTYAYYKEKETNSNINDACALGKEIKREKETIKPCGKCRVCITFGFTRDDKSLHGMAQFSDARILFFPVHSMLGPVWATCPDILREMNERGNLKFDSTEIEIPRNKEEVVISKQTGDEHKNLKKLNLGWLYLDLKKGNDDDLKTNDFTGISLFKEARVNEEVLKRIVVVHDDIFDKIVNSNLEVRTSVAIDPKTGAAEEGALFTYEAIPRATLFWFYVTYHDPKWFDCVVEKNNRLEKPDLESDIKPAVRQGLRLFETLGIGGMQTRGFGRMRILNLEGED